MKRTIAFLLLAVMLSSCSYESKNKLLNDEIPTTEILSVTDYDEPDREKSLHDIAIANAVEEDKLELDTESPFIIITGTITNFDGPLDEGGFVPWYVEWFVIDIETEHGNFEKIIGLHNTAYIFGSMLEIGMTLQAYLPNIQTTFNLDGSPVHLASAIVAGMPQDIGVEVNRFIRKNGVYINSDESFSFVIGTETTYVDSEQKWDEKPEFNLDNNLAAIIYQCSDNGHHTAVKTILLHEYFPFSWGTSVEDIYESSVNLQAARYIFPTSLFETLDLPIFAHGAELDAPPPIIPIGGDVVLLPFRSIFIDGGAGYGNYAFITANGNIDFGGGGAGSENSYWMVGSRTMRGLGWSALLDYPPIVVNGIIYASFNSFAKAAPFVNAWRFDDRIEIFGGEIIRSKNGARYLQDLTSEEFEEFADNPIIVNGIQTEAYPLYFKDDYHSRIMVPILPIIEAMGQHIYLRENKNIIHIQNILTGEVHYFDNLSFCELEGDIYINVSVFLSNGFNAIICDDQIWIIEV